RPAELDDDKIQRGDDDSVLALAAERHEAVGGKAGCDARAGGGGIAALGPEAGAIAVFARAERREVCRVVAPTSGQQALPALRHAVAQVQEAKASPVAGAGPEMNGAERHAGTVIFERGVFEAERREQFALDEISGGPCVAAGGIADHPR